MNGKHAASEQQLRQRIVHIEKRRFVVYEIGIQKFPAEYFPGADNVRCFIDIKNIDRETQPSREETEQDKRQK